MLQTTVPEKISTSDVKEDLENNVTGKLCFYILSSVKLPFMSRPKLLDVGRNSVVGGRAGSSDQVLKEYFDVYQRVWLCFCWWWRILRADPPAPQLGRGRQVLNSGTEVEAFCWVKKILIFQRWVICCSYEMQIFSSSLFLVYIYIYYCTFVVAFNWDTYFSKVHNLNWWNCTHCKHLFNHHIFQDIEFLAFHKVPSCSLPASTHKCYHYFYILISLSLD